MLSRLPRAEVSRCFSTLSHISNPSLAGAHLRAQVRGDGATAGVDEGDDADAVGDDAMEE